MRLINNKYELKIEYAMEIGTFKKQVFYQLLDYDWYLKHKFDDCKILVQSYNFNDIVEYLVKHNDI